MRLRCLERGHALKQKVLLTLIGVMSRGRVDDILKVVFYRPEIFGDPFRRAMHTIMRGPSEWTVGERELFAAFVSHQNQCHF